MKKLLNSRKFRQGSLATAITILVIALIVVINMVASALTTRFNLNLDLTSNKAFTISEETKDFLNGLDKDVTIYVLSPEDTFASRNDYYLQASEVIKNYARQSSRVQVEYIDMVRNPTFAAGYPDLQLTDGMIMVASGNNVKTLSTYDLFNTEYYYYQEYITSSKAEQAMTSAILNVTSDKKIRLMTLTGHGEEDLTVFNELMTTNNFDLVTRNIMTEGLDEEAAVAVIAAPQRDYSEEELRLLDDYLYNDGRHGRTLIYFASSEQGALTNLEAFLKDWGIIVGDGVIFEADPTHSFLNNYYIGVSDYTDTDYATSAQEKDLPFIMPFSRPLYTAFEGQSSRTTTVLMQSTAQSGVRPGEAAQDWTFTSSDYSGPIATMILTRDVTYDQMTPMISYVLAVGSTFSMDTTFMSANSMGNSEYMLDLVSMIVGKEDTIRIQDKTMGATSLNLTSSRQVNVISIILVILFPLAVLATGMVIWLRRRHR